MSSPAPEASESVADIVVVGAGIAGLACAQRPREALPSRRVVVVDKARGVGGRCATRRFDGQPVDHALAFAHGSDPRFLRALEGTPGRVEWPQRVVGDGAPCFPRAFEPGERRYGFEAGLTSFAKSLARGIEVVKAARIVGLEPGRARAEGGRSFAAPTIILTAPLAQSAALLDTLSRGGAPLSDEGAGAVRRLGEVLGRVSADPCLTAVAGFPRDRPAPPWEMCFPRDGVIARISHDSSKRQDPAAHAFVVQATPGWSTSHLEEPPAEWGAKLLQAAAAHLPGGLGEPLWTYFQRWRYANLRGGDRVGSPRLVELGSGCRLGVTGEAFSAKGGVEGAFLAGEELGARVVEELVEELGS